MNNMLKEYIDIKEAIKNPRSINLVIIISEKKFADANNIKWIFIKCSKFKDNNSKIKPEIDGKIEHYSYCIDCGLKKFEAIKVFHWKV